MSYDWIPLEWRKKIYAYIWTSLSLIFQTREITNSFAWFVKVQAARQTEPLTRIRIESWREIDCVLSWSFAHFYLFWLSWRKLEERVWIAYFTFFRRSFSRFVSGSVFKVFPPCDGRKANDLPRPLNERTSRIIRLRFNGKCSPNRLSLFNARAVIIKSSALYIPQTPPIQGMIDRRLPEWMTLFGRLPPW